MTATRPTDEGATRLQGTLTDWNDDRGFGFIAPVSGGPRAFVHVSAFPRGRRPVAADRVTYLLILDGRNRPNATDVKYVVPDRQRSTASRGELRAYVVVALFLTLVAALVAIHRVPALLLLGYAVFSLAAFALYRADKSAAERGDWRVSESTLLLIALAGGWPGALIARHVFRHKTKKQPFRTLFWFTVVANCSGLAWLILQAHPWLDT